MTKSMPKKKKSSLMEEGFISADTSRVQSMVVDRQGSRRVRQIVTWYSQSGRREGEGGRGEGRMREGRREEGSLL